MAFDPTEPVAGSYPNSSPMRENFNQLAVHHKGGTEPPDKSSGFIWWDTGVPTNEKLRAYIGGSWVDLFDHMESTPVPSAGITPAAHATSHKKDGSDSFDVEELGTVGSLGTVPTAQADGSLLMQAVGGGGVVEKAIDHTWSGDGTDNRVIDLGDDYDLIFVWAEGAQAQNHNHLGMAYAFKDVYAVFAHISIPAVVHRAGSAGGLGSDPDWQGKMTGGDANKIKLGSTGGSTTGTNEGSHVYRLVGFKFSSME